MTACRHQRLYFGSGGFFIFCRTCGAVWSPDGDRNNQPDRCPSNLVTPDDERVDRKLAQADPADGPLVDFHGPDDETH